jgi:hypothetical protein
MRLPGSERDDPAHRVVGRHTNSDTVAWNHFDSETPHPAAQLRQHLVAGVALHAVQPTGMNRNHGSLHIYQIVFAQEGPCDRSSPARGAELISN